MSGAELIRHLELSKSHSFLGGRLVESQEIGVAGLIEALKLVKDDSEHGERVQLFVNLLELLANYHHSVLHTEEAISDD